MKLELNGNVIAESATNADIESAVDEEGHDTGWELVLADDDRELCAEISSKGLMHFECWDGEQELAAQQKLSSAELAQLFGSFLRNDDRWRQQIGWTPTNYGSREDGDDAKAVASLPPLRLGAPAIAVIVLFILCVAAFNLPRELIETHMPPALQTPGAMAVLLFVIGAPALLIVAVMSKISEMRAAARWQQTTGKITHSEKATVERRVGGSKSTRPVGLPSIRYDYEVGGERYQGKRISIGEIADDDPLIPELLKRYRLNSKVTVYYDPQSPQNAVLERDPPEELARALWIFAAIYVLIGILVAWWLVPDFISTGLAPYLGPDAKPHLFLLCAVLVVANLIWFVASSRNPNAAGKKPSTNSRLGSLIWVAAIAAAGWYFSGYY